MLELIGLKIKEAREEINMSQRDLGMTLGLSDKAVSAYEASRTIPPLETLVRIADELNKPLDYFINPNSPEYSVETKLAMMERSVTKMTSELQSIKKLLVEEAHLVREQTGTKSQQQTSDQQKQHRTLSQKLNQQQTRPYDSRNNTPVSHDSLSNNRNSHTPLDTPVVPQSA